MPWATIQCLFTMAFLWVPVAGSSKKFNISAMHPLGAIVDRIDLLETPFILSTPSAAEEIRDALRMYGMLLFRGQQGLGASSLAEIAKVFCNAASLWDSDRSPQFTEEAGGVPNFPMVRALGTDDNDILCRLGYEWHVDSSDLTMLYSTHALESGGETLFVSTRQLYDSLSSEQKTRAKGFKLRYSNRYTGGGPAATDANCGLRMNPTGTSVARAAKTRKSNWILGESDLVPAVIHHAGYKRLILSPKNVDVGENLTHNETHALIDKFLLSGLKPVHVAQTDSDLLPIEPTVFGDAVYQHKWQTGDLVLWDNRAVLHSTTPVALYRGKRKMLQLMFSGELLGTGDGGLGMAMNAKAHTDTMHNMDL